MLTAFLLLVCGQGTPFVQSPANSGRGEEEIREFLIPRDQLERFRADSRTQYHLVSRSEVLGLIEKGKALAAQAQRLGPVQTSMTGKVEPAERRLRGTAAFTLPTDHGERVELSPWNLRVTAVREPGRQNILEWGTSITGALCVRNLSPTTRTLEVDWEASGGALDEVWSMNFRTPNCAVAKMTLALPPGWQARSTGRIDFSPTDANGSRTFDLRFGGQSQWGLELSPPQIRAPLRPLLSWRAEENYQVGPLRIEYELRLKLEIDRAPVDQVRFQLDPSLNPRSIAAVSTPADWRREEGLNGASRWTANFRRPPVGVVEIVAHGSLPTPLGQTWRIPNVAVEDGLPRGENVTVAVEPSLRITDTNYGTFLQEEPPVLANTYRLLLRGAGDAKRRPTFRFDGGRAEISVSQQTFFDLAPDRARLTGRLEWTCVRGVVMQPTIELPLGWEDVHVQTDPPERLRPKSLTVEKAEGRGTLLRLPLTRPLTTGETLTTTIVAERAAGASEAAGKSQPRLPLPEFLPLDAPAVPYWYSMHVDPSIAYRLNGPTTRWTGAAGDAGKPPESWKWAPEEIVRFRYLPPLIPAALELADADRSTTYDAELRQTLRWNGKSWVFDGTLSLTTRRGSPAVIQIESFGPLPTDLAWTTEKGEPLSLEELSPHLKVNSKGQGYRLQLPAAAGAKQSIRFHGAYAGRNVEPALWAAANAERFSAKFEVVSPRGEAASIAAEGMTEQGVDAEERGNGDAVDDEVVWRGRYERLTDGLHLRLCAPQDAQNRIQPANGKATIRGRYLAERNKGVFSATLILDAWQPRPFVLRLPPNSEVWQIALDGQNITGWQHSVADRTSAFMEVEIPEPLSLGAHRIDFVARRPALAGDCSLPLKVPNWKVESEAWELESAEPTRLSTGDLHVLDEFHWAPLGSNVASAQQQSAAFVADKTSSIAIEGQRVVALMDGRPDAIGLTTAGDLAEALNALADRLPAGWIVLIDGPLLDETRPAPSDPLLDATSVMRWFQSQHLSPLIVKQAVIFTGRPVVSVIGPDCRRLSPSAWGERLAETVRLNGADPTRRFRTAAQSVGAAPPIDPLRTTTWNSFGRSPVSWWLDASFDDVPSFRNITLTNEAAEGRWRLTSVCAVFLAGCLLFRRTDAWLRFGLAASLVGLSCCEFLPYARLDFFSNLFAAFGASALATLYRRHVLAAFRAARTHSNRSAVARAGAALFIFATSTTLGAPPLPENAILIPFDPHNLQQPLDKAEMPDGLLQRLRNAARPAPESLLSASADYEGDYRKPDQIRWRAKFMLITPRSTSAASPYDALLELQGAVSVSASIDGRAAHFLPPGSQLPLSVALPRAGRQNVILEFFTPIVVEDGISLVEMKIPVCAANSFRLTGLPASLQLVRTIEPEAALRIEKSGKTELHVASGPTNYFRLRWRVDPTQENLQGVSAFGALLLRPERRTLSQELLARFSIDAKKNSLRNLTFDLPVGVVPRRILAVGLRDWQVLEAAIDAERKLVLHFETPRTGKFNVAIDALVTQRDAIDYSVPALLPSGLPCRGVAAVLRPQGWQSKTTSKRGLQDSTQTAFAAAWRELTGSAAEPATTVRTFESAGWTWGETAAPAKCEWSFIQRHLIHLALAGRWADWSTTAVINVRHGSLEAVRLRLPPGLQVHRVRADRLFQWFQEREDLVLRADRPISAEWDLSFDGLLSPSISEGTSPPSFFCSAWVGMGAAEAGLIHPPLFTVTSPGDLRPLLASSTNVSAVAVDAGGASLKIRGVGARPSFQLRLDPIALSAQCRSMVLVQQRGERILLDGRFEIQVKTGIASAWEFRSPRSWGSIEWTAPGLHVRDRGVVEGEHSWSMEPVHLSSQFAGVKEPLRVSWRLRRPAAEILRNDDVLAIPGVRLVGCPVEENWFVLAGQAIDAFTSVPTAAEETAPTDEVLRWTNSLDQSTRLLFYRGVAKQSRLVIRRGSAAQAKAPGLQVVHGSLDVAATSHSVSGRSQWVLGDGAAGTVSIQIPDDVKVDEVRIDNQAIAYYAPAGGTLQLPLHRKIDRQRLIVFWTAGRQVGRYPRLLQAGVYPVLVRIRPAEQFTVNTQAPIVYSDWLVRRMGMKVDDLSSHWQRAQGADDENGADAERIGAIQALYWQAREAVRDEQADSARLDESWNRFRNLVARVRGQNEIEGLDACPTSAAVADDCAWSSAGGMPGSSAYYASDVGWDDAPLPTPMDAVVNVSAAGRWRVGVYLLGLVVLAVNSRIRLSGWFAFALTGSLVTLWCLWGDPWWFAVGVGAFGWVIGPGPKPAAAPTKSTPGLSA